MTKSDLRTCVDPNRGQSVPAPTLTANPLMKRLIDVPVVVELLGCGRSLDDRLIATGELPVVKFEWLTKVAVVADDGFIANRFDTSGRRGNGEGTIDLRNDGICCGALEWHGYRR